MPIVEINQALADIFNTMADILEIQEVQWKPRAFRNAARSLLESRDVRIIYKEGGLTALKNIPGVGEKIGEKIIEYIKTKKVKEYEKLRKSIPAGLDALMNVPGMGPKKAYALYKALKIRSLDDLKKAIAKHRIVSTKGFGEVSEQKISEAIGMQKKHANKKPYASVMPVARRIVAALNDVRDVDRVELVGSLRRRELFIGDIDILTISKKPAKVMEAFTALPFVRKVLMKGDKKSTVILADGMQADLRVFDKKSFGAAMQYFTGNKQHNIELRKVAIRKGLKLNEYGLFDRKGKKIAGETEESVYKALGFKLIPPERRKNEGELKQFLL